MKSPNLNTSILHLAVPAIASNITVPLLGLCDTAITGHLGSASFIAAIAAGSTMLNVVFWLCGFLRMGTTGLAAEACGENSLHRQASVLGRSILLAFLIGTLITLFRKPLLGFLISVIDPSPESSALAGGYFSICVWGVVPLLIMLSVNGWFIGMQNTLLPMITSISMNVINVAASLIAVFVFNTGFRGVAIGTLISNWCALILALILLLRFIRGKGYRPILTSPSKIFKSGGFRKFFNVSVDLFFRSACIMAVSVTVTSVGARLGDLTLATNAVLMQFFLFFSYFMDGFAFAAEALCGKSSGEKNKPQLRRVIRALIIWAAGVAVVFLTIYALSSKLIIHLLTNVPSVRDAAQSMYIFIILLPPVSVLAFIFDGFFIGLTATRRMLLTTLAATLLFAFIVFLLPQHILSSLSISNTILWIAFLSYLFIRGIGLAAQLPILLRK